MFDIYNPEKTWRVI